MNFSTVAESIFESWDEYGKMHREWREQRDREIERAEEERRNRQRTYSDSWTNFVEWTEEWQG